MSEDYTPFPVDHPKVTVPEDGDLASGASLIGLKQLADLTAYLKAQLTAAVNSVLAQAALKAAANAFTQPNTFTDITASGTVRALWLTAQDITSDRDIDCKRDYTYYPTLARTTVVPYQAAIGTAGVILTTVPGSLTLPPNSRAEFPLRLPAGAVLGVVRVCVGTLVSANWIVDITKHTPNFSTGVFGTTPVGTGGTGTVTSGSTPDVAAADGGGATIAADSAYWVTVGNAGDSGGDMIISGVQLNWTDPGPRNH